MKIGIIGSGNIGGALGNIWGKNGHEVMFSSRHPDELKGLAQSSGEKACYGTPQEAAKFGEVVVLAVPWGQVDDAIRSTGPLNGKILIDCTNPVAPNMSGLAVGHDTSAGEEVAKKSRGAKVVKAFNTTLANVTRSQAKAFGTMNPTGFYCGDDDQAKSIVAGLVKEIGLEPVDAGPLRSARYLEPVAMLIMQLAFIQGMGRDIAIKLLKAETGQ